MLPDSGGFISFCWRCYDRFGVEVLEEVLKIGFAWLDNDGAGKVFFCDPDLPGELFLDALLNVRVAYEERSHVIVSVIYGGGVEATELLACFAHLDFSVLKQDGHGVASAPDHWDLLLRKVEHQLDRVAVQPLMEAPLESLVVWENAVRFSSKGPDDGEPIFFDAELLIAVEVGMQGLEHPKLEEGRCVH